MTAADRKTLTVPQCFWRMQCCPLLTISPLCVIKTGCIAAPRWVRTLLQALTGCMLLLQDVRSVAARYKKSVESTGDLTAEDEDADRAVMPKAIRYASLDTAQPGLTCNCITAARRRCRDSPSPGGLSRKPIQAESCDQSSFHSALTLLPQACRRGPSCRVLCTA